MHEVDVTTEIEIDRPVTEVCAYTADQSTAPEWYARVRSIRWVTLPPVRVGSKVTFVARYFAKQVEYTYEITEWEPDRRLVMHTAEGPFPMETTYAWEPAAHGGTRMALRNRGRPAGLFAAIWRLGVAEVRRSNSKDLKTLKAILEARPPER